MKKFLSLIIALVFVFSLAAVASAELNYKWVDVQNTIQQVFGSDGTFYPIEEVNATFWLPDEYVSVDPAEAGVGDECLGLYTLGGNSYVLINYTDGNGLDIDSYYTVCVEKGLDVDKVLINDIPAIIQDDAGSDSFLLMFVTRDNKLLQFIFSPLSNPIGGIVMCSIQPTDIAEETAEVAAEPAAPVNPVSGLISK